MPSGSNARVRRRRRGISFCLSSYEVFHRSTFFICYVYMYMAFSQLDLPCSSDADRRNCYRRTIWHARNRYACRGSVRQMWYQSPQHAIRRPSLLLLVVPGGCSHHMERNTPIAVDSSQDFCVVWVTCLVAHLQVCSTVQQSVEV